MAQPQEAIPNKSCWDNYESIDRPQDILVDCTLDGVPDIPLNPDGRVAVSPVSSLTVNTSTPTSTSTEVEETDCSEKQAKENDSNFNLEERHGPFLVNGDTNEIIGAFPAAKEFLAKITGYDSASGTYGWREVDGDFNNKPLPPNGNGREGTEGGNNAAKEVNENKLVPIGTIVKMQFTECPDKYRFESSGNDLYIRLTGYDDTNNSYDWEEVIPIGTNNLTWEVATNGRTSTSTGAPALEENGYRVAVQSTVKAKKVKEKGDSDVFIFNSEWSTREIWAKITDRDVSTSPKKYAWEQVDSDGSTSGNFTKTTDGFVGSLSGNYAVEVNDNTVPVDSIIRLHRVESKSDRFQLNYEFAWERPSGITAKITGSAGTGEYTAEEVHPDGTSITNGLSWGSVTEQGPLYDLSGQKGWALDSGEHIVPVAKHEEPSNTYWYITEVLDLAESPVDFTAWSPGGSKEQWDRTTPGRSSSGSNDGLKTRYLHDPVWEGGDKKLNIAHHENIFGSLGQLVSKLTRKILAFKGDAERNPKQGFITFVNDGDSSEPVIRPQHNAPKSETSVSIIINNGDGSEAGKINFDEAGHNNDSETTIDLKEGGINICAGTPAAGDIIYYNSTSGCWSLLKEPSGLSIPVLTYESAQPQWKELTELLNQLADASSSANPSKVLGQDGTSVEWYGTDECPTSS